MLEALDLALIHEELLLVDEQWSQHIHAGAGGIIGHQSVVLKQGHSAADGKAGGRARVAVQHGVPIATEKKTTIFTGTDVQRVGGAAASGSGDMNNIILGTSLACAVGVAAAFRADLRALRARERAMRQGAEFSWGPNGHELRIVLPGLRSAEVTAVESGRIEAALLVEPPVLFLLIRFREQTDRVALGLVYSCCWWGSPEERTDPPASAVVRFVLVEGQSGIVRAIRTFSFSLEFTRSFHGAIDEQARLGYDPAHEVAVEAMLRQYLTDQLWHRCQVRCSA